MKPFRGWMQALLWPFAVVLPLVAIGVELGTRICAETLFDPLPTPLHVVLVVVVPLANLAALLLLRRASSPWPPSARTWRLVRFANGLALGVALYYALVFAPLVPISVLAIVAYGLGLLSLSPLLAVISGLGLWRAMQTRAPVRSRAVAWGLLASFLVLLGIAVPPLVTHFALRRFVEGNVEQRTAAVKLLRALGNRELLLRSCYVHRGELADLGSVLLGAHNISPEVAREVYYRVTGDPFNSVPPPRLPHDGMRLEERWDFEQGGTVVGAVLKEVSLTGSRLDGSLDADAALGYLEWTLELRNDTGIGREARAVLALPPGGVVTRATLWIDGSEQEAVFGSRGATRAAYESVVRASRDPLLVTTAGVDHVLVQCFPVPAGGTMKVRLGITTPLLVESAGRARLMLPHFVERNFTVPPELRHSVWVDAEDGLAVLDQEPDASAAQVALVSERSAAASTVRGALDDRALARRSIVAERRPEVRTTWANDPREPAFDVVASLEPVAARRVGRVAVVLDGSRALADEAAGLRQVLVEAPGAQTRTIVLAGDEVAEIRAEDVKKGRFAGGTDNVAALVRAWDEVASDPDAMVVWVHGPQPVVIGRADELAQRCARRPAGPRLVTLAAEPGPNRVLDELDGCGWVTVAARRGPPGEDLRALLAGGAPSGAALEPRLRRVAAGSEREGAEKTSVHLVKLWARGEAARLAGAADARSGGGAASDVAVRYGLVTPWSGAVVLETQQQYEQAGLMPDAPDDVPTIPEPSTVVLLVVVATLLLIVAARRRASQRAALRESMSPWRGAAF
ncbi:MAG TPA: PEP-CTERM sorting domain-containing protein [Thermoanaerobaculia bacterium]|nr:PEP-CTERM sorting domain-containing protein [Thermoanaerobaculia bacterium]